MPTVCVFQLDRVNAVYNSGEYISGRITLTTSRTKRVRAIYVTLEGEAKVQWSLNAKNEAANYYGHQQYLSTRVKVFENSGDFSAGTHVYALMLRIPSGCPSSCKGPYGYIAYNITLTIDKPWSFDEIFCKPILVVQPLNLNSNPEYSLPIKDENIKYFCNWPCSSGPIRSTLVLPHSGYAPQQEIPYYLEVDNQSPHYDVVGIVATLKQHFVYLARKPLKRNFSEQSLGKSAISERTLRLTKRVYRGNVSVPADTPRSTLNRDHIVFLQYTLQLKLKTGSFHYDTTIIVPIVIGTVPLQSQRSGGLVTIQPSIHYSRHPMVPTLTEAEHEDDEPEDDADDDEDSEPTRELANDEPPTYDSCMPPSFSFATLGSQQVLEPTTASQPTPDYQHIFINLPKFPDYNTFTTSAQAINLPADGALLRNRYHSYGSLNTDQTGRSLDTFASSCRIYSENDEDVLDERM